MRYVVAIIVTLACSNMLHADRYRFRHEAVLGTSMDLQVECNTLDEGKRAERIALKEIDRLSSILSSHSKDSEWIQVLASRKSASKTSTAISEELTEVLTRAEYWRSATLGAFDIRSAELTKLWRDAESSNQLPSAAQRRIVCAKLGELPYILASDGISKVSPCQMSLDGLAKGFILDRVATKVMEDCQLSGCCINIGGDIRILGSIAVPVAIESPQNHSVNAKPASWIELDGGKAICTSGNYRRNIHVQGRSFSHIFDPRSGTPVSNAASVSVIATNAADADALATALCVLPIEEALSLVNTLDDCECALIDQRGRVVTTSGWPSNERTRLIADTDKNDAKAGLVVDFTLNRPKGRRYRRPYVAVWLEDTDGFPVKTAVLWLQTDQPGPRWHRDLTRWYRNDRLRKVVEEKELIGTVSGATRGPGEYQAKFDGTDNAGEKLPDGKYTLCLEVAREHGTYQIIREKIELTGKAIAKTELEGNIELKNMAYEFVPQAKKQPKVQ